MRSPFARRRRGPSRTLPCAHVLLTAAEGPQGEPFLARTFCALLPIEEGLAENSSPPSATEVERIGTNTTVGAGIRSWRLGKATQTCIVFPLGSAAVPCRTVVVAPMPAVLEGGGTPRFVWTPPPCLLV